MKYRCLNPEQNMDVQVVVVLDNFKIFNMVHTFKSTCRCGTCLRMFKTLGQYISCNLRFKLIVKGNKTGGKGEEGRRHVVQTL